MQHSAGVLAYKYEDRELMVLLIHPGGPFFKNKEKNCWSIPKGAVEDEEYTKNAAKREFEEETGIILNKDIKYLGKFQQSKYKVISIYTCKMKKANLDDFHSNTFQIEWPPNSNEVQEFVEADDIKWFKINDAKEYIVSGQIQVLDKLERDINNRRLRIARGTKKKRH